MADKGKNKFDEAARVARKDKLSARTFGPPSKWARQAKEITMLPPPSAATSKPSNRTAAESSTRDA